MAYFLAYPFLFTILRLALRVLCRRVRVTGESNVPQRGGFLYCPNHMSDSDPVVLFVTAPRRSWFIGKQELFDMPGAGALFRLVHGLPIHRYTADRKALRRIEGLLKAGEPAVFFPEGRVSEDGRIQPLLPGAAMLALHAGVPIIPVGLQNTPALLPYGALCPRFTSAPITVTYGAPILTEDFLFLPRRERIPAMTRRLAADLARLSGQELPSP
ncbi:MAG: lysophospholipid acyltransferase family protein [Capsulimonadaceae bacterium]